jgi:hypothetical protein
MTKWSVAAALAMTLSLASAGTKLVETTSSSARQEAPPRKILVLGLSKDTQLRSSFEDVLAGELTMRGATAVAAHASFPELPQERAAFEAKLTAEGFDAVTVTRLVGSTDKVKEVEGSVAYSLDYAGSDWWASYWTVSHAVLLPGYLETETRVRMKTDLWRTTRKEGQLVWTGTSETVDPTTVPRVAREIGAAVAKALAKAKLI